MSNEKMSEKTKKSCIAVLSNSTRELMRILGLLSDAVCLVLDDKFSNFSEFLAYYNKCTEVLIDEMEV